MTPAFLITIDTEGDNLWARPQSVETRNVAYLPRFQALCERFGFKPTYLTNWEMCQSEAFQTFGKDVLKRGVGEIGMHLHAWDSPPLLPLSDKDWWHQPYLIEFPEEVIDAKVAHMTQALERTFDVKMTSHRAGRWGFDEVYCRALMRHGYLVDCSVTPHYSWQPHPGHPGGSGGPDFTQFPDHAYYLDPTNIQHSTDRGLLEVPMSIIKGTRPWYEVLARRALNRNSPCVWWLRSERRNLSKMKAVVAEAIAKNRSYLEFTLHSSEFMPGGSPTFDTEARIEALYRDLETLFATIAQTHTGETLSDFARSFAQSPRGLNS